MNAVFVRSKLMRLVNIDTLQWFEASIERPFTIEIAIDNATAGISDCIDYILHNSSLISITLYPHFLAFRLALLLLRATT